MESAQLERAADAARDVPEQVAESRWVGWMARAGLAAKGVSYGLVGILALGLAFGVFRGAADREGALEVVADEPYGFALMFALGLGFAAYALWRLVQAVFDRDDEGTDAAGLGKRLGYAGRAVLYAFLAWSAFALLDGTGDGGSQTQEARSATARVLEWPAGRWLVAGVGLALIGAALFNAYRAFTQKFEDKWSTAELSDRVQSVLAGLSSVGLLARFVVFGLIGAFLVKAAYEYDPKEAIGLDGALRTVVEASYGPVLLAVLAAGLLCYALFCFAEARYRRV
jgi:hypothetical protein